VPARTAYSAARAVGERATVQIAASRNRVRGMRLMIDLLGTAYIL